MEYPAKWGTTEQVMPSSSPAPSSCQAMPSLLGPALQTLLSTPLVGDNLGQNCQPLGRLASVWGSVTTGMDPQREATSSRQ